VTPVKPRYPGAARFVAVTLLQILLLWLTIGLPVISRNIQKLKPVSFKESPLQTEDDQNPVSGGSEEKTAAAVTLSEEFLHHQEVTEGLFFIPCLPFFLSGQDTYLAYHGELYSPPPDTVI